MKRALLLPIMFLASGCIMRTPHLTAPNLLVPPPALEKCEGREFIEHTLGEDENLADAAELYLGKRNQWSKIVECNPGIDPLLPSPGTVVFIPDILQMKIKSAAAVKKSVKEAPRRSEIVTLPAARDDRKTVAIVSESPQPQPNRVNDDRISIAPQTTRAAAAAPQTSSLSGDVPLPAAVRRSERTPTRNNPPPSQPANGEEFVVLPTSVSPTPEPAPPLKEPAAAVAPIPPPDSRSSFDQAALSANKLAVTAPAVSDRVAGAPPKSLAELGEYKEPESTLSGLTQQNGNSMLLCTGKDCLPGTNQ